MEFIHLWDKNYKKIFNLSLNFNLKTIKFINNWGRLAFKSSLLICFSNDPALVNCYLHLFFKKLFKLPH